jgi:hypothetical protein
MAIRLERSGGLIFIHGAPDPPVRKMWWDMDPRGLGFWLVLTLCVAGGLFAYPAVSEWPAITHLVKDFLAAVR